MSAALKQATLAVVLALGMGAFAPTFGQTTSESRAAAIHECSTKAAKHKMKMKTVAALWLMRQQGQIRVSTHGLRV